MKSRVTGLAAMLLVLSAGCSHSSAGLVQEFKDRHVFFEQFAVARAMVSRNDPSVLPSLLRYLDDIDRHERANAAYVFAGLGRQQGFDVLISILNDLSDRPEVRVESTAAKAS
jgi:HEAT repeat protein